MTIKEVIECDNCKIQNEIERQSFAEKPLIPVDWVTLFVYGHQLSDLYFCSPHCAIQYLEFLLHHKVVIEKGE